MRNFPRWDARPDWMGTHGYRAHDHFFTYAELIGTEHCTVPTLGLAWQPTRPPVVLELWKPEPPGERWTTVLSWRELEPIEYRGRRLRGERKWSSRTSRRCRGIPQPLSKSPPAANAPTEHWRALGWSVIDSQSISARAADYRSYVGGSRGELSVAKNTYVATQCGWFSCRTACYLAAGRPAVVQDTGFSRLLPCGDGVVAFRDCEGAAAGVERIEADYAMHARAARDFAKAHLASDAVLGELLERVGVG
jgi:hypothetical protein